AETCGYSSLTAGSVKSARMMGWVAVCGKVCLFSPAYFHRRIAIRIDRSMLPHHSFHVVRHGETEWNRLGRFQGQTDIPLNALGEAQAAALRPHLRGLGFTRIAASPLARARRTAEILNADLNLPIHFID